MTLIKIKIYLKYQLSLRFFFKFLGEIKIDGILKLFFSPIIFFFITVVVYFIYLTNEGKGGNNVNSYKKIHF